MNVLTEKLMEVLLAVLPITIIVTILNFTITPLGADLYIRFIVGALLIVAGLTVFLLGVDIGITQIGNLMGASIAKTNRLLIVIAAGLILGFVISVAEPDLHILAQQVENVTSGNIEKNDIVLVVSAGIALMLALGFIRILYNLAINKIFTVLYLIVFLLAYFTPNEFMAISFDASGATTGAVTVPFILALAAGVSALKKDSKFSEIDSFGMVGIASVGAIIGVMLLGILSKTEKLTGILPETHSGSVSIMGHFAEILPTVSWEVFLALFPIILIFAVFEKISFRLSYKAVRKIASGIIFAFVGLVLFLVGVNGGFMEVGSIIGRDLTLIENKIYVISVGFILGLVTVLAEPAVYVLTHQIENVTSGYVRRSLVMGTLSIGVGSAVALAVINILSPRIDMWHFLLPGYIISIVMSYYVPRLFIGIAFDSGGVASGPMTATFVLAFAHGVADAVETASILSDGFGVIAMVAMTPIIALQLLGAVFQMKSKKEGLKSDGK
ncbi:MAG: DUF1538 domain-containing protein [Synergistaceae bacterium]|nr:DUF1538 domain-containing protein [Synergistaceae bacterium]